MLLPEDQAVYNAAEDGQKTHYTLKIQKEDNPMKFQLIFEGDAREVIIHSVEADATICTLGDNDKEVEQLASLLREPLGVQKFEDVAEVVLRVVPVVTILKYSAEDMVECVLEWPRWLAELCRMPKRLEYTLDANCMDVDDILCRMQQEVQDDLRRMLPEADPDTQPLMRYLLERWTIDEANVKLEGGFFDAMDELDLSNDTLSVPVEVHRKQDRIVLHWPDMLLRYLGRQKPMEISVDGNALPVEGEQLDETIRELMAEELRLCGAGAPGDVQQLLQKLEESACWLYLDIQEYAD